MTPHLDRDRIVALDRLPPADRDGALAHLADCAACRAVLAEDGPERLFSLLALDHVPAEALDRLSASVAAAVAAEEPAAPGRHGFAAASVAASVLLAGLLGTYLFSSRVEVASRAVPAPRVESRPTPASVTPSGFEVVTPEEAEVVRVQIGETQLVMVFDEALNL